MRNIKKIYAIIDKIELIEYNYKNTSFVNLQDDSEYDKKSC